MNDPRTIAERIADMLRDSDSRARRIILEEANRLFESVESSASPELLPFCCEPNCGLTESHEIHYNMQAFNFHLFRAGISPADSASPQQKQVTCLCCGGSGWQEVSMEMAIDAGDRSMTGSTTSCGNCSGAGWVAEG